MHLGPAGGQSQGELQAQLPQGLVRQCRERIDVNGDDQAVFHLKAPQPALLALLASGFTPVYPCHVSPRDMRQAPIGTGPFKFVEYQGNQGIKVVRNPNYWKPGLPYLDGIEYTIIPNRSTAILAFVAGKFDMIFPYELTVPLVADVKKPDAGRDLRYLANERGGQRADEPGAAVRRPGGPPRRRHDDRSQVPSSTS